MSASAMVYACMHSGEEMLRQTAIDKGARPDKGNAQRTIEVSEFFRFLQGEQIPEFTSGKKGSIQDSTANAYAALQAMSAKRHKILNQALCKLTREFLPGLVFTDDNFEVSFQRDMTTDAIVTCDGRPFSLEFHHLSGGQCGAANMASYMMDKLRTYSWHHQLIPR